MNFRDIDWGFGIIMLGFGLVATGVLYGGYLESQRPEFCLKKDDWKCTGTVTRTHLQSVTTGTVTALVPVTETHCVKYEPSAN